MMSEMLLDTSLFGTVLTLSALLIAQWIQKKAKTPLLNPVLVSAILIALFLGIFRISNADYQQSCRLFSWLLTPTTVCLAVPLYEQVKLLRKNLGAIIIGAAAGTISSLFCILGMSALFHLKKDIYVSILPKSITTAMGLALSEQMDGISGITAAMIIATGILGSMLGSDLCRLFRITNPIAKGVAFGTSSHVIGTSRASQLSELTGAVSSLSLVIAGVLTALLFPLFV